MIAVPGYLIRREIGAGGMATVYLAVQTSLEREVALKVMNPTLVSDPNFSRRFLMEARTLASLSHPNIVAVYDVGVTDAQLHYFSMQHLPNGDFAHRIRSGVSQSEVVRVLLGVARALGFAHARGFVHRDVSPANVMFDASDNPVLTDFGIARAVTRATRLTSSGVSVGTSHYMSPEQARGGNVDARSDLYSLGAVAYEALVGKPPFEGDDGFAIAYAHVFEPIPRLPEPYAAWQPLIDRCLAKQPNDRFLDADAFIAELERIAVGAGAMPAVTGMQRAVPMDAVPPAPRPAAVPLATTAVAPILVLSTPSAAPVSSRGEEAVTGESAAAPTPEPVPAAARRIPGWWPAAAVIVLGLIGLGLAMVGGEPESPRGASGPGVAASIAEAVPAGSPPPAATPPAVTPPPQPVSVASPESDPAFDPTLGAPGEFDSATELSLPTAPGAEDPAEAAAFRTAVATTVVDPLAQTLALARADLAAERLTLPPQRNARDRFRLALSLANHFRARAEAERAQQGLVDTAAAYLTLAEKARSEGRDADFLDLLARGEALAVETPGAEAVTARAKARRAELRDAEIAKAKTAVAAWKRDEAIAAYERALRFDPASAEARKGREAAARVGLAGYVFRDRVAGANGPEMIVVETAGKRLAVARTEITLGDFRRYWRAAGSRERADRPGCRDRESFFRGSKHSFESPDYTQTDRHPVVCVSWRDADAYVRWLARESGARYRLPTEAEWTAWARGAPNDDCRANFADAAYDRAYSARGAFGCDDGHAAAAPVRSFDATGAGLYDIAGNVREWIAGCAPAGKDCVAMGSAWHSIRGQAEPTQRARFDADLGLNTVGLRVVRELD